jgi:hypothetical protein
MKETLLQVIEEQAREERERVEHLPEAERPPVIHIFPNPNPKPSESEALSETNPERAL